MKLSIHKAYLSRRWFFIKLEPETSNDQMILKRIEDKLGVTNSDSFVNVLKEKSGKFLRLEIYI